MSNQLNCLCYTSLDSEGRRNTIVYTTTNHMTREEIEADANKLRARGEQEVRLLSFEDAFTLQQEENKVKYNVNVPTAIDSERFTEMLEVLPPCRWDCNYDREIFFVSEAITADLHSFYVRLGRGKDAKYFEVNASCTSANSEIFKLCEAA